MKKPFAGNYYLGVDIGTESVGWAVTNDQYEVLKFNGNAMWGVRLFDEANTAAERRIFRTNRRRLQRRNDRLRLLQEIFASEISKIDYPFFQRLNDSRLLADDKTTSQIYSIFADVNYSDPDYYKEYPTIYHLRQELIMNPAAHDVRLVYLALHNILKHRGHFLIEGNLESVTDFKNIFNQFLLVLSDVLNFTFPTTHLDEIESLLKDKKINRSTKKTKLKELFCITPDDENFQQKMVIVSLVVGLKGDLTKLFLDQPATASLEKNTISFSEASYEETREELRDIIPDEYDVIDTIKNLYDWSILADILADGKTDEGAYLSVAKVAQYEKYKADLKLLKAFVKKNLPDEYTHIFTSENETANYANYTGHTKYNGKNHTLKKCKPDEFYTFLKKKLKPFEGDEQCDFILSQISEEKFLKFQIHKDNGVIPYQVHKIELLKILDNASQYLPFLQNQDTDGISNKEKIQSIFEFRIPYYVGPINTAHEKMGGNSWMVRKETTGSIRPWNFEQKVNLDASAMKFIERMTNKCTYLLGEDVLPKNSLLYSEYTVLNELNNLQIQGRPVDNALKKKIVDNLFKTKSRVTGKALLTFLKTEGYEVEAEDLSGFDKNFQSSLASYLDFKKKVFKDAPEQIDDFDMQQKVEDIIRWICIYGEDKKMLKRVILKNYPSDFTEEQLKAICILKYTGWGRFSRKLLQETHGADVNTGEAFTMIEALRETTNNFMQLLSARFTFNVSIDDFNNAFNETQKKTGSKITYESITEDLYVSPSIKRSIWQVVLITEELRKIMGKQPTKIFVEMARGDKNALKGDAGRKQSRQKNLLALYANIKDEAHNWKAELEKTPEDQFRNIKLYLYYTQKGRCMYTGEAIDLDKLMNENVYDRDHIYPQSKTKDDSFDNLVLVKKEENARKGNQIVDSNVQAKMRPFWKELLTQKLISEEKYKRLTRTSPFTEEELAGFINRQLVETRQSSKAVADLFKKLYTDSTIVYVKAESVSSFRRQYEFIKVRSVNDYHHARDAYLNIVVGNVYHEKFTSNPLHWLKTHSDTSYSLNQMFNYNLEIKGKSVWRIGNDGSIATVRKFMAKNNILYTRHSTVTKGGFFDQNPIPKKKTPNIPLKQGLDPHKYGGYSGVTPAYFSLIESEDKKGKKLTIEAVPLYLVTDFEKEPEKFLAYCEEQYGLVKPVVKLPKIKKNALLVVKGFPMHLRGSNGISLTMQGAVQLCLDDKFYHYCKKIEKYVTRNTLRTDKKQNLPVREKYDEITKEKNALLYDALLRKQTDTIYKNRPASQVKKLKKRREDFESLSVEEQCIVLSEVLKLMRCRPITADLKLLGEGSRSGNMAISKTISFSTPTILKNQSPTGLFEQNIDLLKL